MESAIAGRRRTTARHSAEDQALDQIAKEVWLDYFMSGTIIFAKEKKEVNVKNFKFVVLHKNYI